MSKFAEKLSQATRDIAPPMGFGAAAAARRGAPMLLVADITGAEAGLSAVKELADAALLTVPHTIGLDEQLPPLARGLGGVPFGVWMESVPASEIEDLAKLGCDFVVFGTVGTSSAIIKNEDMGKMLAVDPAMPDSMAGAVGDLELDAVAIKAPAEQTGISVHRLLVYHRFSGLTQKPLMVPCPRELTSRDLEDLLDAGVYAVLVGVEEVGKAGLQQVREAIKQLPAAPKRRPTRTRALVPRVSGELPRHEEEEEEDQ